MFGIRTRFLAHKQAMKLMIYIHEKHSILIQIADEMRRLLISIFMTARLIEITEISVSV